MSLVHYDSFQRYNGVDTNGGLTDLYVGQNGTGNLSLVTVGGRQRVRTAGAGTGTGGFVWPVPNPTVSGYVQVWCSIDNVVSPNTAPFLAFQFDGAGGINTQFGLRVEDNGSLQALRGYNVATIGAPSSAGVMISGSLQCIEVEYVVSDTVGRITVWVDNVQVLNLTNQDTKQSATVTTVNGIFMTGTQGTSVMQWADLIVDDAPARYGPRQIDCFTVTADTAQKDFTPSTGVVNYAMLDDIPIAVADYVTGSTVGQTDLYDTVISLPVGTAIDCVKLSSFGQKTDAAARSINLPVKVSAQSDGAAQALTTNNSTLARYMTTNPNSAVAWTVTDLDALQVGLKVAV